MLIDDYVPSRRAFLGAAVPAVAAVAAVPALAGTQTDPATQRRTRRLLRLKAKFDELLAEKAEWSAKLDQASAVHESLQPAKPRELIRYHGDPDGPETEAWRREHFVLVSVFARERPAALH